MKRLMQCAVLMLALGTAACEDGVAPPEPGTAIVNLNTIATDAGVVLLTLTGPGITDIQPANSSYQVFWRIASETETRVIVVGTLTSGPLITAQLGDVGRLGSYTTTLVEAAGRDGVLKGSEPPVTVTLSRLSGR